MPLEVRAAAAAAMMRTTSPPEKKAAAKVALLPLMRISISVSFTGNFLFLEARSAQSLEGLENLFCLEFLWLLETPESRELPEAFQLHYYYCICRSLFGVILVAVISIYRHF